MSYYLLWFAVLLGLVSCVFFYLRKKKQARFVAECDRRGIKYVPIGNNLLAAVLKRRQEDEIREAVKQHGPVFGFSFQGTLAVMVAEPELLQIVLSKEFTNFVNRQKLGVNDRFLSNILSAIEDEKWKRIRSIVTPTFTAGKVRRMKPLVDCAAKTLLGHMDRFLQDSSVQCMKRLAATFTMDTIMQVAFGVQIDSLAEPDNPIISCANKMLTLELKPLDLMRAFLVTLIPPLHRVLPFRFKPKEVDFLYNFTGGIVAQKRAELAEKKQSSGQSVNENKPSNFIELLLEAEAELTQADENGKKSSKYITNDELLAQCVLFLMAAYDTTANTISMTCYHFALHPEIQDKLYREIASTIQELASSESTSGDCYEQISFESLARFEYLAAVINETLRVSSPATGIVRSAGADFHLATADGKIRVDLKKGDLVKFPIYTLHRDERYFPEPNQFRPERFLGEPTFHKYSYIPFGAGPRNCVARSLGLLEAKIALIHLVRKYRFSVCNETLIPMEFDPSNPLHSPKSVKLHVEKR